MLLCVSRVYFVCYFVPQESYFPVLLVKEVPGKCEFSGMHVLVHKRDAEML